MSITIIDNTKPKAKIWEYKPVPTFRTTYESDKYRAEQMKLYIEGYADIPGTLIFKCQETKIKDRVRGGTAFRPQTRFADLMIHQFIDRQRKKKRMISHILKPRGIGLSTDFGCLANYFPIVQPGTNIAITSKNQAAIFDIFNEKVLIAHENLDPAIKPVIESRNNTAGKSYIKLATIVKNQEGRDEVVSSNIYCRETSERPRSPNNFSGTGAIIGLFDEFPLHPRKKELIRSVKEIMRDPATGESAGMIIAGGTVEQDLSGEDFDQFANLIQDVLEHNIEDLLFIPYYWGKYLDENGYPQEELAREWYEREEEELSKSSDPIDLIAFRKNNPRDINDIFEMASKGFWEPDVEELLIRQREKIILNPPPTKRGKVVATEFLSEFIPMPCGNSYDDKNPTPPVTMLEEPKHDVEYLLLIDGVMTGSETGSTDGSKVAGVIMKLVDKDLNESFTPVALYYERPKTVEDSYYNLINLAKYYNKYGGFKKMVAEANAGTADHFSTFLRNQGLWKWVAKSKDLSGKGYTNTGKPFQYVNDITRAYQIKHANIFLRKYWYKMKIIPLLTGLIKGKQENSDCRDSMLMFFTQFTDIDKRTEQKKQRSYLKQEFYRDSDGSSRYRWVETYY